MPLTTWRISILLFVRATFAIGSVDSIIQKAKSWADEGNHGEEGAAGFAVCLLMNELDMSRVQSVNTLKENGNRIFINVNTESSMKKKNHWQ